VADRVADAVEAPIALAGRPDVHLTASIGIAVAESAAVTAEMLLRDADMAMYAAKNGEGVRYEIFDERLRSRTATRLSHEQELRTAIARDELELVYQPLFGVEAGSRPVEFEALVRWRHPRRGLLCPAAFIGLAEESGLIVSLDRWVLRQVCADSVRLGIPGARIWMNMSPKSLDEPLLAEQLEADLDAMGLTASSLGIEITERAVVEGGDGTRETLRRLRALGVQLAADDFGTGFSSLSALIQRPVDVLKIDRSFVSELPAGASVAVVRAIVAMASALGLRTVAEGVEREEQLDAVRGLDCDRVQGYLLARPMSLAVLMERYAARATAGTPLPMA
jgi:EAL domain-containing protein (putative c-di-GMP-specific phosphodiesterase class I)